MTTRRPTVMWCSSPMPCRGRASLLLSPTDKGRLLQYGVDEPMLFVGHYWRRPADADPPQPGLPGLQRGDVRQAGGLSSGRGGADRPEQSSCGSMSERLRRPVSAVLAMTGRCRQDLAAFVRPVAASAGAPPGHRGAGAQVLWVPMPAAGRAGARVYLSYPAGAAEEPADAGAAVATGGSGRTLQLRASWMTRCWRLTCSSPP